MNRDARIPVIVVTGTVGAGKSTTVSAISDELGAMPIRHAAIDMDHLRWVSPEPEGDRFGVRLGFRNLAAIWPNLLDTGITCAILADVVESPEQVRDYHTAMPGADVTVVRLDVSMTDIVHRLEGRESASSITWYLQRAPELQGIMEREGVGDIVLEVCSRSPIDIAREIITRTGIQRS